MKALKLASKAPVQNKSKVLNKYQIATRSCFVPATIIRDEVDIKGEKHGTKFGKTNLTQSSKK